MQWVNVDGLGVNRRHVFTNLILQGGDDCPALVAQRPLCKVEHMTVTLMNKDLTSFILS